MDSIWQRHRTFILKILGGLGVCLLAWIIGSSLSESDLDTWKTKIGARKTEIRQTTVHSRETTGEFLDGSEVLLNRILFLADRVGETRTGEELRVGLLREILSELDRNTPENVSDYLQRSRQFPQGCLTRLVGEAYTRLASEAALKNVYIEEGLGFDRVKMEPDQLDRYLQTLKLMVQAVKLGIEEGVFEVKQLGVLGSPGDRFQDEETFLRMYPVTVSYRGPSAVLLRILESLNEPDGFRTIRALRRFQKERQERDGDVLVMELELMALQVRPDAEVR